MQQLGTKNNVIPRGCRRTATNSIDRKLISVDLSKHLVRVILFEVFSSGASENSCRVYLLLGSSSRPHDVETRDGCRSMSRRCHGDQPQQLKGLADRSSAFSDGSLSHRRPRAREVLPMRSRGAAKRRKRSLARSLLDFGGDGRCHCHNLRPCVSPYRLVRNNQTWVTQLSALRTPEARRVR